MESPKDFTEDQIVQEMTKLQEFNVLMNRVFFCSNCQVEQVLKEKCCSIQLQGPNVFCHLSWELQGRYWGQVKTNRSTGWGWTRKYAIQVFSINSPLSTQTMNSSTLTLCYHAHCNGSLYQNNNNYTNYKSIKCLISPSGYKMLDIK